MNPLVARCALFALVVLDFSPALIAQTVNRQAESAGSNKEALLPGPAVFYLLAESDDGALESALADILVPVLRRSDRAALAISLWQEPGDRSVCFQIVWEDGELCSGSSTDQTHDCNARLCPFLVENPFTFDSDEIYAMDRPDRPLPPPASHRDATSFRDHSPPVFLITSEGVDRLADDENVTSAFVAPLMAEYELPITMISLRLLDPSGIHVTVFDGGRSIFHAVRIEGVELDRLTLEDYRLAERRQQAEHASD